MRLADEYASLNDRLAAGLTRLVGSMWTVYLTLAFVGTWMALGALGPLHAIDPYPFPFMLFLGNVVQLLLCFVILVGQRVLGRAADSRAAQTYEHAEAIFREVSGLHDHLVRQDRQLSRGVSLLEWDEHPWIGQHHLQEPPRAADHAVGVNGRLAAWLTERVGSMWAFYAAAIWQFAWMGLSLTHLVPFDPYPFPFLLFLSSLVQLVLMFVIMVGQDVLGLAGDRRSQQTFFNAAAVLHACRRMEEHLTAQDRLIASLSEHMRASIIEQLARAMHRSYLDACIAGGERIGGRAALVPWERLAEEYRESSREQARHAADKLASIDCAVLPRTRTAPAFAYRPDELTKLARLEHDRWARERTARGVVYGPQRDGGHHPDLVPWEELSEEAKEKDVRFVRTLPQRLAEAGFEVVRLQRHPDGGARPSSGVGPGG